MSPVWMSHVTRVNESCHPYEWVMSHVSMRLVTYWKCHVTHTNVICTCWEWVMLQIYCSILFAGFDLLGHLHYWPRVTWLIYMTKFTWENESRPATEFWMSCACEWVMVLTQTTPLKWDMPTHKRSLRKETFLTHKRDLDKIEMYSLRLACAHKLRLWTRYVAHMNESCRTHKFVTMMLSEKRTGERMSSWAW